MSAGFYGLLEAKRFRLSSQVTGVKGAGFVDCFLLASPPSDLGADRVTEDKWDNEIYLRNQRLTRTTAQTGDTICTSQATKNEWLVADGGSSIGKTGSGATYEGDVYEPLFNTLKTNEVWDDLDTVTLPSVTCDAGLTGFIKI